MYTVKEWYIDSDFDSRPKPGLRETPNPIPAPHLWFVSMRSTSNYDLVVDTAQTKTETKERFLLLQHLHEIICQLY